MPIISPEQIQVYRARTFRYSAGLRLRSRDEAVQFVRERGCVFFWPITGITFPSLWAAVAGDRAVADEHDDPGHVTWGWKDALLGSQAWYYGKILRKKSTMIAFDLLPYFYALSENYGAYEEDYLTLYEQGRLTSEARAIYEALLDKGRLDTVELRRITHMSSPGSEGRFNRALTDLQADFKILPVGVTQSGAWHYAFAFDIVARHYPELPEQAHQIREDEARRSLVEVYFRSLGAAQARDVNRLFGWRPLETDKILKALVNSGRLLSGCQVENQPGEWLAISDLVDGERYEGPA
jgi:hypothetical protein